MSASRHESPKADGMISHVFQREISLLFAVKNLFFAQSGQKLAVNLSGQTHPALSRGNITNPFGRCPLRFPTTAGVARR